MRTQPLVRGMPASSSVGTIGSEGERQALGRPVVLREALGAVSGSLGERAEPAPPLPPSVEGSARTSVEIIKTKIVYNVVDGRSG